MPPRLATRPTRENDFSNVGKVGRRTGVTLPQGRIDVNGMEEISGIFSSPRKPSPLKNSISIAESVEDPSAKATPSHSASTRKSLPPPRSASPRKSGISGTARRSRTIDLLGQNKNKQVVQDHVASMPTPKLLSSSAKRFSPDKTPVKDPTKSRPQTARSTRQSQPVLEEDIQPSVEIPFEPTEILEETDILPTAVNPEPIVVDDYDLPPIGDDDDGQESVAASLEDNLEDPPVPAPYDDEEADETFKPETRKKLKSHGPMMANSRRKRKSDATSQEADAEAISSPAAKRAKRISDQTTKSQRMVESPKQLPTPAATAPAKPVAKKSKARPPLKDKSTNMNLSTRQEQQLNQIIEKHKPRPGQKSSLYVLRRETPTDNSVTHTRSGRVSFKPLAYWRNEKCVYQGSPGSAGLQDGERFPLNSIKEIIRTDEAGGAKAQKSKTKSKSEGKSKSGKIAPSQTPATDEEEEESSDVESENDEGDPDAEPWEVEKGIFRGFVASWDQHEQAVGDEEDEMDIAYAPASIETREVKGSAFRYAKLLSTKFFGSGIVDLPPGGVKKTKNSRKMHMSFFVATGRVTVNVGAINGPDNQFSIGEGGWWQVPRGNQYSIKNVLQKPARIFFSQACEAVQQVEEE